MIVIVTRDINIMTGGDIFLKNKDRETIFHRYGSDSLDKGSLFSLKNMTAAVVIIWGHSTFFYTARLLYVIAWFIIGRHCLWKTSCYKIV